MAHAHDDALHEVRRKQARVLGEDCSVLLGRLVNAGFLDAVRASDGRRANRYRLTTDALQALGVASPEELRAKMGELVGDGAPIEADRR